MEQENSHANQPVNPLNWRTLLEANPQLQEGMYNPARKTLLKPGVSIRLSRTGAESWLSVLRQRRLTAEVSALALGKALPDSMKDVVTVTIVEVPEKTQNDPSDGTIIVEADEIQGEMSASVFYNSIPGPYIEPSFSHVGHYEPLIGNQNGI